MDSRTKHATPVARALVVDDSITIRSLVDITLTALGIKVDFASNGEDALKMVKQTHYDVIYLDIMLPGIDGLRVCKTIKDDAEIKATPVVMLTSKDQAIDKLRGTMAGANVYLTKPLDRDKILQSVKTCLSRIPGLSQQATA